MRSGLQSFFKEPMNITGKDFGKEFQFEIGQNPQTGFNAADGFLRNFKSEQLQARGKLLLRQPCFFPSLSDSFSGKIAASMIAVKLHQITYTIPKMDYHLTIA